MIEKLIIEGAKMSDKALIEQMNIVIADTYVALMLTQSVHWNFTGTSFYGMHQMTEEQYQDMFEAVDTLSERVRAKGHMAPSGMQDYTRLTTIVSADVTMLNTTATCQHLIDANQQVTHTLKKTMTVAQEEDDLATEDLLIERVQQHEKFIWMLTAVMSGTD